VKIKNATLLFVLLNVSLQARPPAVPLVTHDPYFSIWSMADKLTDENTKHWTGSEQPLTGLVRIDGKTYRYMGTRPRRTTPALEQTSLAVMPTRTVYTFADAGVRMVLTFFTPAFPEDLDLLSRAFDRQKIFAIIGHRCPKDDAALRPKSAAAVSLGRHFRPV